MLAWLAEHAEPLATKGLLVPRAVVEGPLLLDDLYGVLTDAESSDGKLPSSATPGQRVLHTLMDANDEIAVGGIDRLFRNAGADGVRAARDAARAAGMTEHARLLDDALAGRRARVDGGWFDLEGLFYDQLTAYVHAHAKDFFADAR
jgi:hypothetical protein